MIKGSCYCNIVIQAIFTNRICIGKFAIGAYPAMGFMFANFQTSFAHNKDHVNDAGSAAKDRIYAFPVSYVDIC